jgi:hypothetical protein
LIFHIVEEISLFDLIDNCTALSLRLSAIFKAFVFNFFALVVKKNKIKVFCFYMPFYLSVVGTIICNRKIRIQLKIFYLFFYYLNFVAFKIKKSYNNQITWSILLSIIMVTGPSLINSTCISSKIPVCIFCIQFELIVPK